MKRLNKHCKKYYNRVKKCVYIGNKELTHLKSSLHNFTLENPDHDYDDLVNHFGSPEDIVNLTITHQNLERVNQNRFYVQTTAIIVAILLLLLTGYMTYLAIEDNSDGPYHAEIFINDLGTDGNSEKEGDLN